MVHSHLMHSSNLRIDRGPSTYVYLATGGMACFLLGTVQALGCSIGGWRDYVISWYLWLHQSGSAAVHYNAAAYVKELEGAGSLEARGVNPMLAI